MQKASTPEKSSSRGGGRQRRTATMASKKTFSEFENFLSDVTN